LLFSLPSAHFLTLALSSDSKCALELKILRNSFSEARINAIDFESARFFGTFPKFAHPDAHFVRNCAPEISAAQYKLSSLVPHAIPTLHMCTSTFFESAT
jgi:hypothetical protein